MEATVFWVLTVAQIVDDVGVLELMELVTFLFEFFDVEASVRNIANWG